MTPTPRFNRERFLFFLLAGVFTWQAVIFTYGVVYCTLGFGKNLAACPELGQRYESTTNVMIATTLALLTGSAVSALGKDKDKSQASSDDDV